jgi:hypothetical protein
VEPGRQAFLADRNPDRRYEMVRELGVLLKALSLSLIVPTVLFIGFLNRPLRRAPMNRRYEIILSRRYQVACLFSSAGPLFPSAGLRLELYGYIRELFYTLTNGGKIVGRFHSTGRIPITRPWLIPIDAVSLYDIVQ